MKMEGWLESFTKWTTSDGHMVDTGEKDPTSTTHFNTLDHTTSQSGIWVRISLYTAVRTIPKFKVSTQMNLTKIVVGRAVASYLKMVWPKSCCCKLLKHTPARRDWRHVIFNAHKSLLRPSTFGQKYLQFLASRISIVATRHHCEVVITNCMWLSELYMKVSAGMVLMQHGLE